MVKRLDFSLNLLIFPLCVSAKIIYEHDVFQPNETLLRMLDSFGRGKTKVPEVCPLGKNYHARDFLVLAA